VFPKKLEMAASPCVLPSFVAHQVRRHGEKPRPLAGDRLLPRRSEKSLLRDFFRPVAIPQSSCEVTHERLMVFAEKSVEVEHRKIGLGSLVSGLRKAESWQLSVTSDLRPET
jgi:hypothetical protein